MAASHLSNEFRTAIRDRFGAAGERWIFGVEREIPQLLLEWGLTFVGIERSFSYNQIFFVRDESQGRPYVLKIGYPDQELLHEARALEYYNGHGCARLERANLQKGYLLLE